MNKNIVNSSSTVNLDELATKIRDECAAVDIAGRAALDHGIIAGKYCLRVHQQIDRGFRHWLAEHGFKKTTIYDFMKLAENEQIVRSSGQSSIAAALRMLRAKADKSSGKSNKLSTGSPLSKTAWTKATVDERRRFLDAVGANSLCEALSFALRVELRRRVAGQQAASTSALSETIARALRQALSLQKAEPKDTSAMGVASALNAVNNKLAAAGLDLNNLTIVLDQMATQKRAAA